MSSLRGLTPARVPQAVLSEVTWAAAWVFAHEGPHLLSCSTVTILKFLIFEKGVLRVHSALDPAVCGQSCPSGDCSNLEAGAPAAKGAVALREVPWGHNPGTPFQYHHVSCGASGSASHGRMASASFLKEVIIKEPCPCWHGDGVWGHQL